MDDYTLDKAFIAFWIAFFVYLIALALLNSAGLNNLPVGWGILIKVLTGFIIGFISAYMVEKIFE